jgi:hypothetical protein
LNILAAFPKKNILAAYGVSGFFLCSSGMRCPVHTGNKANFRKKTKTKNKANFAALYMVRWASLLARDKAWQISAGPGTAWPV